MPDIPVPQIILNQPGVCPVIGQRIATGMAQHVRMRAYRKLGFFTGISEEVIKLLAGKGATGTGNEKPVISGIGDFFTDAQPGAEGPDFPGDEGVNSGKTVLEPGDVDTAAMKVNIGKAQAKHFRGPETVKEGHEDEAVVTFRVGPVKGCLKQEADLLWGEEFTFLHKKILRK